MENNGKGGTGAEELYRKLMRSDIAPYIFNLADMAPRPIRVVHPCQTFAEAAKFSHWNEVVAAIKAGKIVSGPTPISGTKSMWNIKLFYDAVHAIPGAYVLRRRTGVETFGIVSIGLRTSFDPAMIAESEADKD